MRRKFMAIVLALAGIMAVSVVAPAFAKNMHVSEGVKIAYFSGGEIILDLVSNPWPAFQSQVVNTPKLLIHVQDVKTGSFGAGDQIIILLWFPQPPDPPTTGYWVPLAHFTTNPDSIGFWEDVWYRSPMNSPASEKNTIQLSENQLKVDRHGNEIFASLTAQGIQKKVGSLWVPAIIPAFTIELTKIGGSIHDEGGGSYPIYTLHGDIMGFNANGVFTSGTYTYTTDTDCVIKMHAITTFEPNP